MGVCFILIHVGEVWRCSLAVNLSGHKNLKRISSYPNYISIDSSSLLATRNYHVLGHFYVECKFQI